MSLQDAINQLQTLAPKSAGHLVRHQDWNTLIAALGEFGTTLTTHDQDLTQVKSKVQQLETQLAAVSAQAQALDDRLDDLEQQVQPLLNNYIVTLSCTRLVFAAGEQCELTARVTNLRGQPLPAPLPWVDFIAAWGRLRAKAGFNSQPGSGDNSISVQVNAQGIAQVLLRAEHSEGFSETQEAQVGAIMNTGVQGLNMSVAQAFLSAPTPTDHRAKSAYQVLSKEYDRQDSIAFRSYADTYHVRTPEWTLAPLAPQFWTQWRDYRATVIALAKPDADPTTPDSARGSASIQIVFRDWLWPWTNAYLDDLKVLEDAVVEQYTPLFEAEDLFDKFQNKFNFDYVNRGIVGKKKYLMAAQKGMERINPGTDPTKQNAKQQIALAIAAQESAEVYGSGKAGQGPAVMQAYVGQDKNTQGVKQQVQQVSQQIQDTKAVQASVNVLEGRMQAAERVGRDITSNLTLINDNVRALNPLDEASLKANVLKISADIALLKSRLG